MPVAVSNVAIAPPPIMSGARTAAMIFEGKNHSGNEWK
jgi:hypothetical protein